MMTKLTIIVSYWLLFASYTHSQCPNAGCNPNRCFCFDHLPKSLKENPEVKQIKSPLKLSNRGCITNDDQIVCPLDEQEAVKEKAGCLGYKYEAQRWWKCTNFNTSIALPLIGYFGNVMTSDGHSIEQYSPQGREIPGIEEPPDPIYGQIFDLATTNNTWPTVIHKCGRILLWNSDDPPWDIAWLNSTGTNKGRFVPLATPATNDKRMYLLTGFWPTNASKECDYSFTIRLYAIDTPSYGQAQSIAWYYEKKFEGKLSAIKRNYESCSDSPTGSADDHNAVDDNITVAQVMFIENTVIAMFNYETSTNKTSHVVISLTDNNTSFRENCISSIKKEIVTSLASFQAEHFKSNYIIKAVQQTKDKKSSTQLNVFDREDICKPSPLHTFNMSTILFNNQSHVQTTTQLLTLVKSSDTHPIMYIVFGAMTYPSQEGYVIALQVNEGEVTVVWKVVTPDKISPTGQISIYREDFIVFSTGYGILLYSI